MRLLYHEARYPNKTV